MLGAGESDIGNRKYRKYLVGKQAEPTSTDSRHELMHTGTSSGLSLDATTPPNQNEQEVEFLFVLGHFPPGKQNEVSHFQLPVNLLNPSSQKPCSLHHLCGLGRDMWQGSNLSGHEFHDSRSEQQGKDCLHTQSIKNISLLSLSLSCLQTASSSIFA